MQFGSLKMSKRTTNILLVVAVLVVALVLINYAFGGSKPDPTPTPRTYGSLEFFADGSGGAKVILFHATWCGYCKEYLTKKVDGSDQNTFDFTASRDDMKSIAFEKVDADEDSELTSKYGIKGFPTIIGVNAQGEKVAVFEGDRYDSNELAAFAKTLLSA